MHVLRRARRSRRNVLAEDDRASGAGRRELDHSVVVPRCVVDVEPPTQVAIELLGPIDVRDGQHDDLECHIHGARGGRFPERRFKDLDVLFNGAAAYADASDQLAVDFERCSAAHGTILSSGHRHKGEEGLPGCTSGNSSAVRSPTSADV